MTDPANQSTTYVPDGFGGVTQTTSADTGVTTRTYDAAGNLRTETDARGITVTYTYDALNRMSGKTSSDASTPSYTYAYDSCTKGKGRLCYTYRNSGIDRSYAYNALGRLRILTQYGDLAGVQYTYRPGGQIETMIYNPSGRVVAYLYDTLGRVKKVTTQGGEPSPVTLAAQIAYYPFGDINTLNYGNGKFLLTQYDLDYRPTLWRDGPWRHTYGYDEAGHVSSLTRDLGGIIQYAYDATGRLGGATDAATFGVLGWIYDGNGNRQSETRNASTQNYVYNPAGSNWLYQVGSDTRPKTANGNLASSPLFGTLSYDGYNRLAGTSVEITTYTYNALGQRIKKANQFDLTTSFMYDEQGRLLYEKTGSNTKEYVWLGDRPLARIDNGTSIYTYHTDRLGTPQAMTNSSGAIVWQADYEPFGKANVAVATVENNLRLPGQYFDRETGLHYNYFRDYDPTTGRYIEADPIGLEGGVNLYTYVGGDPMGQIDPNGLASIGGGYKALKCSFTLRSFINRYGHECSNECDQNEPRFIDKYTTTGELDRALLICACRKAGQKSCNDFISECLVPGSY